MIEILHASHAVWAWPLGDAVQTERLTKVANVFAGNLTPSSHAEVATKVGQQKAEVPDVAVVVDLTVVGEDDAHLARMFGK